jgi:hypothetical protein
MNRHIANQLLMQELGDEILSPPIRSSHEIGYSNVNEKELQKKKCGNVLKYAGE